MPHSGKLMRLYEWRNPVPRFVLTAVQKIRKSTESLVSEDIFIYSKNPLFLSVAVHQSIGDFCYLNYGLTSIPTPLRQRVHRGLV